MKKLNLWILTALLVLPLIGAAGCNFFGGNNDAVAGGTSVNAALLATMVIPVAANAPAAVNAAPNRALADDVEFIFKNAKTLALINLSGAIDYSVVGQIKVVGEFKGVVVLVEVKSKATPTKIEKVVLGEVANDNLTNYTTVTLTSQTPINPATMLATRNLINNAIGATTDDKIKALGATLDTANALATADISVNNILKEATLIATAVESGVIAATGATTDDKIIALLTGVKPEGSSLTTINDTTTALAAVYPTITGVTPATIAKKDVEVVAGNVKIAGTNFSTDAASLEVMLGTFSVPDGQLTVTATQISFNLTAAQALPLVDTDLAVIVKQSITTGWTGTLVTLTAATKLRITAAVLASIAVTPDITTIVKDQSQQFIATGTYDDTTTKVLTADVTWTATAGATPAFSATTKGLYTAPAAETPNVVVTATLGAISGTETFNVISSPLNALNLTDTLAANNDGANKAAASAQQFRDLQLYAYGVHDDVAVHTNQTTSVTWTSGTPAVATVGAATGIVSALTAGSTVITATAPGGLITKTITVNVSALNSVAITAPAGNVARKATYQFIATGTYADASTGILTNRMTWAIDKTGIVKPGDGTIDTTGLFTGKGAGILKVTTAALGAAIATSTSITVTATPVALTFATANVTRTGSSLTLTWTTDLPETAVYVFYGKASATETATALDIDPISMQNLQQPAGTAATTHTYTITDFTSVDAGITATTQLRIKLLYQFSQNEKYFSDVIANPGL